MDQLHLETNESGDDGADAGAERLAGRDIVCFANDWAGDPLSKKHIMRRLAERNRVLWVDSIGGRAVRLDGHDVRRIARKLGALARGLVEVEKNIHVLSPIVVPAYGSHWDALNRKLLTLTVRAAMRWLGFGRPLLYTFSPASALALGGLGETRVIYHCVDEFAAFAGAGPAIATLDAQLVSRADLVIVCSEPLLVRKRPLNPRTVLLRHGVDHAHFSRALLESTVVPPELAGLPRPIFGFHGLLAEWIDYRLLRRLADEHPNASVVLVGEARVPAEALSGAKNIYRLGRRPYATLPGYCKGFDVALLPFVVDELTVHATPLKLREYLSAGLPVVSTALPEAYALGAAVRVATTDEEFLGMAKEALSDGGGPRAERSRPMENETWDRKVREIERHILALDEESARRIRYEPSPVAAS